MSCPALFSQCPTWLCPFGGCLIQGGFANLFTHVVLSTPCRLFWQRDCRVMWFEELLLQLYAGWWDWRTFRSCIPGRKENFIDSTVSYFVFFLWTKKKKSQNGNLHFCEKMHCCPCQRFQDFMSQAFHFHFFFLSSGNWLRAESQERKELRTDRNDSSCCGGCQYCLPLLQRSFCILQAGSRLATADGPHFQTRKELIAK